MNLDTENNLLSVLLMSGIGLLVMVGLAAFLLFGRADMESIDPVRAENSLIDRPVATNPELAELSEYAEIIERPVFFADRQLPVIELAGDQTGEVVEEPEPEPGVEVPDLEATVAGIIITPELRLAMVTDNSSNETQVMREGMAMAGEKSAWKLAEIHAREVRFETEGGRTRNLELVVETGALKTGAPPRRQASADDDRQSDQDGSAEQDDEGVDDARARAEEIRRRVAERRAELRAEAERRAREQDDGG